MSTHLTISLLHSLNLLKLFILPMILHLDQITYTTKLRKHLPERSLQTLLKIFNYYFISDIFPPSWHQANIILIPKPNKDDTNPNNYRPIALTSCCCKIFERIVNLRLNWYLEINDIINPIQSGFRKQRSTTDHLVRLESFIRVAFIWQTACSSCFL